MKQLCEYGDLPGGSRSRSADRRSPRLLSAAATSSNRRFVSGEWTHLGHQSEAWAVARSHQGAGHRRSRQSRADSTPGFTSFGHRFDRRVFDSIDNGTRRNLGRVSRIRVLTLSVQTVTPQRGRVAGEFAPVYREVRGASPLGVRGSARTRRRACLGGAAQHQLAAELAASWQHAPLSRKAGRPQRAFVDSARALMPLSMRRIIGESPNSSRTEKPA